MRTETKQKWEKPIIQEPYSHSDELPFVPSRNLKNNTLPQTCMPGCDPMGAPGPCAPDYR